jgi:uncharacterized Zn finger protein
MASPSIASATLFCENCGRTTPHRVLRLDRASRGPGAAIRGVARCRECRLTHPFESVPVVEVERDVIVSSGSRSKPQKVRVPRFAHLQVGNAVPGTSDPLTIRRLEDSAGRSVRGGDAREIATIWAVRDEGAVVRVSILEGAVTRASVVRLPHGTVLEVGEALVVDGRPYGITALRADGKTWRRPGDRFRGDEVVRAYVRRTAIPPAGRRDWSRSRVSSSSDARAASTPPRSRSSPGTSVARRVPRARSADGGADDQSRSPE